LTNNAVEKYVYLYDRADWDSIKDDIVSLIKNTSDFNTPCIKTVDDEL